MRALLVRPVRGERNNWKQKNCCTKMVRSTGFLSYHQALPTLEGWVMHFAFCVSCVCKGLLVGHVAGNLSSRSRSAGYMTAPVILYERRAIVMGSAFHIDRSNTKNFRNTLRFVFECDSGDIFMNTISCV